VGRAGRFMKRLHSELDLDKATYDYGLPLPLPKCSLSLRVGAEGAVGCELRVTTPKRPSAADRKFEASYFSPVGTQSETKPDDATFRPLLDWFGRPSTERIAGVHTAVFEATTRIRTTDVIKRNRYQLHGSFEAYVAARDAWDENRITTELMQVPISYDDLMKMNGVRPKEDNEGSRLRAKVWLAREFPLSLDHMRLLLDVIAVANKSAAKVSAALGNFSDRDAFPMKVHVPLLLSLYAQLGCTDFEPNGCQKLPPGWFDVPADYEEVSPDKVLDSLLSSSLAGGSRGKNGRAGSSSSRGSFDSPMDLGSEFPLC